MKRILTPILGCTFLLLAACTSGPNFEDAQYWQRSEASDMAYTVGPKAQQMLSRDIARCVTELRELERQGQIKNAIPTDRSGRVLTRDQQALMNDDTPNRQGDLLTEHSNYYDFEGCMASNGWERVKHVPYDVARKGEKNYWAVLGDHIKRPFGSDREITPDNDYQMNE